eukprot:5085813-Amphidinium_carterae.1
MRFGADSAWCLTTVHDAQQRGVDEAKTFVSVGQFKAGFNAWSHGTHILLMPALVSLSLAPRSARIKDCK